MSIRHLFSRPSSPSVHRVPEWRRSSTFRARLISLCLKWALYIMLIPGLLSGAVIGASLELGSSWSDAFKNLRLITQTTVSTYETNIELIELSTNMLLSLEGEGQPSDLDMITYAAEARSQMSALSAELDQALANYLKAQVQRSKERAASAAARGEVLSDPVTLSSVFNASLIGALIPLALYWVLSYLLTIWWLNQRDRETLEIYGGARGA